MKQVNIKFKVGILIAVLLLVGMVLLDLVMVAASQQLLLRNEKEKGYLLLELIGASSQLGGGLQNISDIDTLRTIVEGSDTAAALWVDGNNNVHWLKGEESETAGTLEHHARTAKTDQSNQFEAMGYTWGVFWLQKEYLVLAAPFRDISGIWGAAGVSMRLAPTFSRLRATQTFIGWYLLINILLLSSVGLYRIHHIALRPVLKIIRRAEAFRPGDSTFSLEETGENELNRLSRAFNRILDLNREDQGKLQDTVAHLERALLELRQAQQEIVRAEKLATVGRLSSGIAHEIGNPIGIVLGYLALIKDPDTVEEEKSDYIQRAESEIARIQSIIRQLLDYSRSSSECKQSVSVHEILAEIVQMVRIQPMFTDVELDTAFSASKDIVLAEPDQLKQLFLNFILNSADAIKMKEQKTEGRIHIKSDNDIIAGPDGTAPSRMIRIQFEDNGTGIAEDDFNNIFDPFFTTKPPGMGSGLGLWVSLLIAEAMGGKIDIESRYGEGTRVLLTLPVQEN